MRPWSRAWLQPVLHLQILLALALLLGGGGVAYGLRNLLIQLCALAILALNLRAAGEFVRHGSRWLQALLLLSLALPLLQLVPLPAAVWQQLPGRALVVESFAIIGHEAGNGAGQWYPLSLDRARTLVAFCGTLAPAAIIIIGSTLELAERLLLVRTLVILALIAFLVGVIQLSMANTFGLLYPIAPRPDVLYATFANRNSTGLLFVTALALLAALPLPHRRERQIASVGAGSLLALGAILTQSRSSMVLLALVIGFVLFRIGFSIWQARRSSHRPANLTPVIALIVASGVMLAIAASAMMGGRAADSFERFAQSETDRPEMWEDGIYAARQYWPVGSGMGTFDEVFQVHESLEYVSPRRAGRAHNDYIEIAIEGGMAALLLTLAWLGWSAFAALGRGFADAPMMKLGAGLGIGCIALQSVLDYPLRNQSLLCVAALLIVILAPLRTKPV